MRVIISYALLSLLFATGAESAYCQVSLTERAEILSEEAIAAERLGTLAGQNDALRLWAEAAEAFRRARHAEGEAEALHNMGRLSASADTGLVYYRRALPLRREAGDRRGEARTLHNMAVYHRALGRTDSTIAYYRMSLTIIRTLGDPRLEAGVIGNIGSYFHGITQLDSAAIYYQQALSRAREIGELALVAYNLNQLGYLHRNLGQPDTALAYMESGVALRRQIGDRVGTAYALNNLGLLERELGRPDDALELCAEALQMMQELRGQRLGDYCLGHTMLELSRPDSALVHFEADLQRAKDAGNRVDEGWALISIGMAYRDLGQRDSALIYLQHAFRLLQPTANRHAEAAVLVDAGRLYVGAGLPDTALVVLEHGRRLAHDFGLGLLEGVALLEIGRAQLQLGRLDEALVNARDAVAALRRVRSPLEESRALQLVAKILLAGGSELDLGGAVAYFDSAAVVHASIVERVKSDENRLSLGASASEIFEGWSRAWLARERVLGQPALGAALAAAERGRARALLDLMMMEGSGNNTVGAPASLPTASTPGGDLAAEGQRMVDAVRRLEATVMEYLLTRDSLIIWIIPAHGEIAVLRPAIGRDSIARLIASVRHAIDADSRTGRANLVPLLEGLAPGAGIIRDAEAAARTLAGVLIPAALRARLPVDGEIVIVPDGTIALVPFSILPIDSAGTLFGERYALRYAPSLATLIEAEARPTHTSGENRRTALRNAVVLGNPSMPSIESEEGARHRLPALPNAQREAERIAARLGVNAITGASALETAVRWRLATAPLVHFATHGFAYSSAARARASFIALAHGETNDGLLTVGEVLDELSPLQAELVVLSACQTGLGNLTRAEGTIGLQRAFLARGARTVLVSLWSVDDAATELLMERFYGHWLEDHDGPGKAEALRRAQHDVRNAPGFGHPRFWAAFQLVGGG